MHRARRAGVGPRGDGPARLKACVFGAGAIGGHIAARLHAGGADTSVVARGPHLAAMQTHGLRVETPDGTLQADVRASDDPAALGPQDHVIVAVKAPALPALAGTIPPLLGPNTAVTFAMNGIPWWYFDGTADAGRTLPLVDPDDAVRRAVGPARALGCVVYSGCTVIAPGVVQVDGARSRLVLGEPGGALSPRVQALAAVLRQDGMEIDVVERIRDRVWAKLLLNLGTGPLCVLAKSAPREVFADEACCEALRRVVAEGAAIARAMGADVAPDPEAQLKNSRRSTHTPSVVQDLELGRPMEIDALYRQPLAFAREHGLLTPTLDLLVALVVQRARMARLYI